MKLCDRSVLVDIDRGGPDVDRRVARLDDEGRHVISTVTVIELRIGVNKRYDPGETRRQPMQSLDRLLARFDVAAVTRPVAIAAADIVTSLQRQGTPIHDLHDVYIAATAVVEQLPVLTANVDGDEYTVTPTLVEAFGRSPRDQDLDLLIEKHGMGKLAAALTYAIPYAEGEMSERIAARELELQYAFTIAVLHALRAVVVDMKAIDPYFDDIRNARDHPVATK